MRTVHRSLGLMVAGMVLLAAAGTGLWTTSSSADDAGASPFASLSLSAVAGGQRVLADAPAGQAPGTVDSGVPDAEAQMTASTGHALASAAWPTALVGNLGTLLGLLGPAPCTPDVGSVPATCSPVAIPAPVMQFYPLLNSPVRAEAQYPTHEQDSNSLPGTTMTARADGTKAAADAVVGAAQASKNEAFGSLHATSSVGLSGTTAAVADAVSSADNVSIGGLVTIGSIASEAHATTDGTLAKSTGSTTVQDMKVGGIPVYVDGTGVHGGSAQVPDAPATAIVNQLLSSAGFKVSVTQPVTSSNGGSTSYDAGSVVISFDTGTDAATHKHKLAYFVFGGATVTAAATPAFQVPSLGGSTPGGTGSGVTNPSGFQPPVVIPSSPPPSSFSTLTPTPSAAGPSSLALVPAAAHGKLPKGLSPFWVVLAVLGAGLIAGAMRPLPDRILDQIASPCPLEEEI